MSTTELSANQEKRKIFDEWMKDDHTLVQVNTKVDGVVVPARLANDPALTLKLSYRFQGDTIVDDQGITAFLLFGKTYEECVLPWDAIWGIRSEAGEQRIWKDECPREVLTDLARQQLSVAGKKIVDKVKEATGTDTKEPEPISSKGHLKRIK